MKSIDGLIQADDMRADTRADQHLNDVLQAPHSVAANSENKEKPSTEVAGRAMPSSTPSATADVAMSNNTAGDESPRRHHESKKTRQRRLHEAERFITFTDAVVAIAMTLLILPLQEAASSWGEGETEWTASDFFSENRHKVGALALSFCVIALYWNGHDSMFQNVGRFTPHLLHLNFAWMFGIIFFPVATAVMTETSYDDVVGNVVYLGTVEYLSLIKIAMCIVIRRDERTWKEGTSPGPLSLVKDVLKAFLVALALLISVLVPSAGMYTLFLLVALWPLMLIVRKIRPDWTETTTLCGELVLDPAIDLAKTVVGRNRGDDG